MNNYKFVLSIALGALLTMGLLVGFSLGRNSAVASAEAPEAVAQTNPGEAIQAQGAVSTAHVVVRFADNDTIVREITFTQPITSYRALELANLNPVGANTDYGLMLCGIDDVGEVSLDGTSCDNGSYYWGTFNWDDDSWVFDGGVEDVITQDGHLDGFSWGTYPPGAPTPSPGPQFTSAQKALDWLQDQQQADGGFGNANSTSEALMAVSANGIDASTWRHSPSLLANMISNGAGLANKNAAGVGKLAVGLAAQESCWPIGAQSPLSYYDPISGTFDDDTLYQAWGILGTAALSETVPVSAVEALKDAQLPNGGWEWAVDQGSDTNNTALALQALIAAGEPVTSTSVVSGLDYLKYAQNDDGGFPYNPDSSWGTDSDTNSTAYVVQALFAAGEDPLTGTWTVTSSNPISYLLSMQLPDGSFEWQKGYGTDQWATRQAIPALLGRAYPLEVGDMESCYGLAGSVSESGAVGAQAVNDAISDVTVWAEGAGDLYFGTTISPTSDYTISVPSTGTYSLTPFHSNYIFSPTGRSVEVSGAPGDVTSASEFEADPAADLSVSKVDSVDPIGAGNQLTYTITVRNTGLISAENVIITDFLPTEIVSPTAGTVILPQPDDGTIVMPESKVWWRFETIEPGEVQTLTLGAKIQPWATHTFTNTVKATTSSPESDLEDNQVDESTSVKSYIYLPLVVRNSS